MPTSRLALDSQPFCGPLSCPVSSWFPPLFPCPMFLIFTRCPVLQFNSLSLSLSAVVSHVLRALHSVLSLSCSTGASNKNIHANCALSWAILWARPWKTSEMSRGRECRLSGTAALCVLNKLLASLGELWTLLLRCAFDKAYMRLINSGSTFVICYNLTSCDGNRSLHSLFLWPSTKRIGHGRATTSSCDPPE